MTKLRKLTTANTTIHLNISCNLPVKGHREVVMMETLNCGGVQEPLYGNARGKETTPMPQSAERRKSGSAASSNCKCPRRPRVGGAKDWWLTSRSSAGCARFRLPPGPAGTFTVWVTVRNSQVVCRQGVRARNAAGVRAARPPPGTKSRIASRPLPSTCDTIRATSPAKTTWILLSGYNSR
jgi:hypothetical protein